jgi:hypothetical protein
VKLKINRKRTDRKTKWQMKGHSKKHIHIREKMKLMKNIYEKREISGRGGKDNETRGKKQSEVRKQCPSDK